MSNSGVLIINTLQTLNRIGCDALIYGCVDGTMDEGLVVDPSPVYKELSDANTTTPLFSAVLVTAEEAVYGAMICFSEAVTSPTYVVLKNPTRSEIARKFRVTMPSQNEAARPTSGSAVRYTVKTILSNSYIKTAFIEGPTEDETRADGLLVRVYAKSEAGEIRLAQKMLFADVEGAFSQGNLQLVDALLNRVDVKRLARPVLVGLLRATYRARGGLTNWGECLIKVTMHLSETAENPSHVLRGLYPSNGNPPLAARPIVR